MKGEIQVTDGDGNHAPEPARSPVDDALDRLEALENLVESESEDVEQFQRDLDTVREALERLRRHLDAWSQRAFDQQKQRAEAAEAEAQRYREGLREARASHLGDQRIANELVNHFPVEIRCDHETRQDKVFCDCARVDLGWHPSVRLAKESWAQHVIESVKSARAEAM